MEEEGEEKAPSGNCVGFGGSLPRVLNPCKVRGRASQDGGDGHSGTSVC